MKMLTVHFSVNLIFGIVIIMSRCHVKIGTPYFGDPGSLYSQRFRDPGPYSTESMGTRIPILRDKMGTPLTK